CLRRWLDLRDQARRRCRPRRADGSGRLRRAHRRRRTLASNAHSTAPAAAAAGCVFGAGSRLALPTAGPIMPFIPHTRADIDAMLKTIGAASIEDLFDEIPPQLKVGSLQGVPEALN